MKEGRLAVCKVLMNACTAAERRRVVVHRDSGVFFGRMRHRASLVG